MSKVILIGTLGVVLGLGIGFGFGKEIGEDIEKKRAIEALGMLVAENIPVQTKTGPSHCSIYVNGRDMALICKGDPE